MTSVGLSIDGIAALSCTKLEDASDSWTVRIFRSIKAEPILEAAPLPRPWGRRAEAEILN